ncbi:hypothetical protein FQN54_000857 [Arachnomyces sp. PD_36]|nr:hypothetical protein FQN54_000857 [Arachnomyces sp. PD_36]
MPAGEVIIQDGRRCTKVKRDSQDATSIFENTSTATNPAVQTEASLTQGGFPSATIVNGESPDAPIVTSTTAPIPSIANTNTDTILETSSLSGYSSGEQSDPSATRGSGLNLPTGSGITSFPATPTPNGSISGPGAGDQNSDGNEGERASPQNPGIIAGGIIGGVVIIVMIIVAWTCIRRRRRKQRLAESPSVSNNNSATAVGATGEKPSGADPASTRGSQLPATASYSTFATKRSGAPDSNQARNSGTPLVPSGGRPNSQYLESGPVAQDQQPDPDTGIKSFAAGIFAKLRGIFPSSSASSREGYQQQPSHNSSARSSYNERTDGPMLHRRLTDSSLPRSGGHEVPMPNMLNPFADPSSTNQVQPSPIWRSPLSRNPFEDPAPPDEDFPFPSPIATPNAGSSRYENRASNGSSVIQLPGRSSAGGSVRSVSLDATASEISRWRRERDSRISTRSDPFDLERSASARTNNGRRTNASNTARSSRHLAP